MVSCESPTPSPEGSRPASTGRSVCRIDGYWFSLSPEGPGCRGRTACAHAAPVPGHPVRSRPGPSGRPSRRDSARPCPRRRPGNSPPRPVGFTRIGTRRAGSGPTSAGIGLTGRIPPVRRWSDRQHLADRHDSIDFAVLVDERLHRLNGLSNSAWATYADALRRISLAWRSSRTSHSNALSRSCSLSVVLSRSPLSFADCRIQRRGVSAVPPIFWAVQFSERERSRQGVCPCRNLFTYFLSPRR